jgi:hypothetical protein
MKTKFVAIVAMRMLVSPMMAQTTPVSITGTTSTDGIWDVTTASHF